MSAHSRDPGEVTVTYRCLDGGLAPRRIAVVRPGWAGESVPRADGSSAQPWHCAPFSEGASYGLELLYPFKTRCEVAFEDGRPRFNGKFSAEQRGAVVWPPFQTANPGHYSLATLIDIKVSDGFAIRVEPHPSFFTDRSGVVPAAVIGNVQSAWWPLCLFVTFKSPNAGQVHVFEYGSPYCQIIPVVDRTPSATLQMDPAESAERELLAQMIMRNRKVLSERTWVSHDQLQFDDVYKQLRRTYLVGGHAAVRRQILTADTNSRKLDGHE